MVAGSLRTLIGKIHGGFEPEELLQIAVRGPLPARKYGVYFPTPADMVVGPGRKALRSAPRDVGAASWMPEKGLLPCLLEETDEAFKPLPRPQFLDNARMVEWLLGNEVALPEMEFPEKDGKILDLASPREELRTHVAIEPETYAAEEGKLFTTAGLSFDDETTMYCEVEADGKYGKYVTGLKELHPLGGERRLAAWRTVKTAPPGWECPEGIRKVLSGEVKKVKMVLATPGIWGAGWRPRWASPEGGTVPGTGVKLRLVGACVDRWKPISGFNLVAAGGMKRGPKPARWMAPAGSTYFFEVSEGKASELAGRWMKPVLDGEEMTQPGRDGFGLALWGIWR
jgi:CRISPR-associated protein Cmr3